ncbi:MAG: BPTI/Kunitz domain-containing protein, partial [Proteobacteria bacterium]|nr:BPTI/Kunitz domain-containing protein [Pseudomonadota bacterium]
EPVDGLFPPDLDFSKKVRSNGVAGIDPRCGMIPDPGPCKGLFEMFFYAPDSDSCESFFYGGCEGEAPFETLTECQASCLKKNR